MKQGYAACLITGLRSPECASISQQLINFYGDLKEKPARVPVTPEHGFNRTVHATCREFDE